MLDCARHFFPLAAVRETIDALAFAKFNVLHLHLSDDQSFPFVSRAYPTLAAAAFGPTEKYTLSDLTVLGNYARDRGVLLIPEFDAPGHATAWCTAYPALCPSPQCMTPMVPSGNLSFDIIATLARETGAAFGSGIYHGGGDEVHAFGVSPPAPRCVHPDSAMARASRPRNPPSLAIFWDASTHTHTHTHTQVNYDCWTSSPAIKAWMVEQGFTTPQQAYAYFLARVAAQVAPSTPMFWQDAYERSEPGTPLPSNTIIQFYKSGPLAAAADAGHPVVYSNNHDWGLTIHTKSKTWDQFYTVDPTAGLNATQQGKLLGGEACVWTVMIEANDLAAALWPRLLAVSEKLWSPARLTHNATANDALARLRWARCALNARGIAAGSALGNQVPAASPLYGSCLLQ